jgi:hypothetical protein
MPLSLFVCCSHFANAHGLMTPRITTRFAPLLLSVMTCFTTIMPAHLVSHETHAPITVGGPLQGASCGHGGAARWTVHEEHHRARGAHQNGEAGSRLTPEMSSKLVSVLGDKRTIRQLFPVLVIIDDHLWSPFRFWI